MDIKDELANDISKIIQQNWEIKDARRVAENEVPLEGGVRLDATVLIADLTYSSKLATENQQKIAAKIIRIFLRSMCKLIVVNGGTVTNFDGEHVMGVFLGDMRNTNATTCALKMNYVTSKMIPPTIKEYFNNNKEEGFNISHCVGVDTSPIIGVRAGVRGSNDLIWIGRAPQLATKLSHTRNELYHSYISEDVFFMLFDSAKFSNTNDKKLMWEETYLDYNSESTKVYRSNWNWEP